MWEVVNDGRLPFPTVSDYSVTSLQLPSEDGVSDSLTSVVWGTVRRCPHTRISWQDAFERCFLQLL